MKKAPPVFSSGLAALMLSAIPAFEAHAENKANKPLKPVILTEAQQKELNDKRAKQEEDWKRIQKERALFEEQLKALKDQRRAALQKGNAEEARQLDKRIAEFRRNGQAEHPKEKPKQEPQADAASAESSGKAQAPKAFSKQENPWQLKGQAGQ